MKKNKLFFFCVLFLIALSVHAQVPEGYVDLGLPSGTLWKEQNEQGFYEHKNALRTFGNRLPTKEQFEELCDLCLWTWMDNGYKLTGPNGNVVFFPAAGYFSTYEERAVGAGKYGKYWSSSTAPYQAWRLEFASALGTHNHSVEKVDTYRLHCPVRLVQRK